MRMLSAAVLALATTVPALATAQVGVSVNISQPGLYGRIDIGDVPPPALIYAQPIVVVPGPVAVQRRPIYLHVPPGYERNWGRYCGRYSACGQPVLFVRDDWYREHGPRGRGYGRGHDDRRDDHRGPPGHDRGHGHGHGKDKGHGHGHDR